MAAWREVMSLAQTLCYLLLFLMAGSYLQNSRSVVDDSGNNPLFCIVAFLLANQTFHANPVKYINIADYESRYIHLRHP